MLVFYILDSSTKNKNVSITIQKDLISYRGYEIMFSMDYRQGFKFVYRYDETLTLDKNIEEISMIIDKLITDFYKKGEW